MLFYIDRCVDTLFIFDLFLSFIRPYENKVGDTVTQIPSILRNYFSWWEPRLHHYPNSYRAPPDY